MNVIRGWRRVLLSQFILWLAFAGPVRMGWAAEATRFLVSYGGTAGYQLPLWVNKEFGFSKKHGVDLEIILIQAGSPNIQALLGGSLQLTQTAASSAVIGATQGAPVVIVATLENGAERHLNVADRRHVGAHGGAHEQEGRCDRSVLSGNISGAQTWHERPSGYRRLRLLHQHVEHHHSRLSTAKSRRR